MQRHTIVIFLIVTFILISCSEKQLIEAPTIVDGILDVSSYSIEHKEDINLDGKWEFYWNRLLVADDFKSDEISNLKEFIDIPGTWSQIEKYPAHGFGTLRLKITGLNRDINYSLYVPEMLTSYILFIDGKLVYQNGVVGMDSNSSKPQFLPATVSIKPENGSIEIVCQVSNFDYRKSGIWRSMKLGTENRIHFFHVKKILLEMFLSAILLAMSIFHISIYNYRREIKAELLFGLTCLLLFLRTITTGEQILTVFIPSFPWDIARKLEFTPFYLLAPIFLSFIFTLFPKESIKIIDKIFLLLFGLSSIFYIFLPVRITNNAITISFLLVLIGIIYAFSIIIRALLHRRKNAIPIVLAFSILAFTFINDILFSMQIISTMYLTSIGFLVFIFIQSHMLSLSYAKSFKKVQALSFQLKGINESLSRFVPFQFLEYLKKNSILDVNLGDQVLENMTILFADIRSFTSLSENMTPEENFKFLNSFLSQVVPVIRENGGFVDKFIGDAIMALFPYPPDKAVHAAIELQKAVRLYNEARGRAGYRKISLGIGIHTGQLMLGTIGETNRMETTVIADAVNIASRLENLTKVYGSQIIISRELFKNLEDTKGIIGRSLGKAPVKGKSKPIEIIEILVSESREIDQLKIDSLELFEKAVNTVKENDYEKAAELFRTILDNNADDKAAALFHKHCVDCIQEQR